MRDYASLYSDLLADLEIHSHDLPPVTSDMGAGEVARISLASSFYKKLCPNGNSKNADAAALKKFLAINESIPEGPFRFEAENEAESCFYDYFKYHFRVALGPHESIGSFDMECIREGMGVGPGAAQKADSSSMVTKLFESPMSYMNPNLIPLYRAALSETGFWADAEMQRFKKYGFVKVQGGKLFFASKNAEISRTCCTEASLEMLFQKAIGAFLEFRLGWYFGISLSTQPDNNRELARIGSIDGSFGTIDLTSASDSISLSLMDECLENNFLKAMIMASRSKRAVLPDGSEVTLRMISTMGNGFTFPLQTVIFASAVKACYQLMGFSCDCARTQFGVFGDDIVVRREVYYFLCRMLNKLGFSVNVGKSFNTGLFRESCGSDYYAGTNVRGVYIRSLETPQHVYSAINRLTRWSADKGIPLRRTLKTLINWVRIIPVPPSESDDAGICVPFSLTKPRVANNYWFKYRCYVRKRKTVKVVDTEDGFDSVNQAGIAVGFLSGAYRRRDISLTQPNDSAWKHDWSVSYSVRDKMGARARYRVISKSIPWWDYWPDTKQASSLDEDSFKRSVSLTRGSQHAWNSVLVALFQDIGQVEG